LGAARHITLPTCGLFVLTGIGGGWEPIYILNEILSFTLH
jgi:hypothetical protein